jgi:hypothetical protein
MISQQALLSNGELMPRKGRQSGSLSDSDRREIHRLFMIGGLVQKSIAVLFGITQGRVSQIIKEVSSNDNEWEDTSWDGDDGEDR